MPRSPLARPSSMRVIRRSVALLLLLPGAAASQDAPRTHPVATDPAPGNSARGPRDRAEVEAFFDGVMAAHLPEKRVAGATVSVVRDGQILFAKGYGFADVAARKQVDPERTLFRIGSVTKLFTWTAVMQLVEAGKLDLDTDVNRYLDFAIPATYPEPITLRHILTHTPGFEEDSRDLFTEDSAKLVPLGRWLATHIPGRVRPPGTYSSYSNYATALAGHIVARVSGMSWDEYLERHIFEPLGMRQTTGRQPLPARFVADMSKGYESTGGTFAPEKFELITGAAPAGSMSSSATDMARFMLAHLGNGALDGQRILRDSTAALMHSRAFGHDERIPGFALGFYEQSSHGLRIIGHGGDTRWFHTNLTLIPSENVGVFVSYNTDTGGELSFGPVLRAFLDHYYPTPAPPPTLSADAEAQARRVAGEYQFNRRSYTTFQKAIGLSGAVRVDADSVGALVVRSPLGDMRMVPVGPLLYREELGQELLAFKADSSGRVTHGFMGLAPMMALERVPWHESPRLHLAILGAAAVIFGGVVLAAIIRFFRARPRRARDAGAAGARLAPLPGRGLLVALALANLAFLVAVMVLASNAEALLLSGSTTGLEVALALPIIGVLLALAAAVVAVSQWRKGAGSTGARLRYASVVVVALLFVWSLNAWNLLGWRM